MLELTARDALQENQETGIRRIIRTFDPDIPGYVFWLVMLGLISFQVTGPYTSDSAPHEPASGIKPQGRKPAQKPIRPFAVLAMDWALGVPPPPPPPTV